MVTFTPAGVQWISGCAFDGIYLHPGSGKQIGVLVNSSFGGRFIVTGRDFTQTNLLMGCATGLSENADCMMNYVEVRGSASGTAALVQLIGIPTANTCFNTFGLIDGNYEDGSAVQLYNCDNNVFERIRLYRQPGKTGVGIVLNAGAFNEEARSNLFLQCTAGDGGMRANGTDSGASASKDNAVLFYDKGNGAPDPTYGTGATLRYSTSDDLHPAFAAVATGTYGAGPTDVAFGTERYDLAGNFATPSFTARKPGLYRVTWQISYTAAVTVNDKWVVSVVTPLETVPTLFTIPTTAEQSITGACTVRLLAGQTVKLQLERTFGSGSITLQGDSRFNRFEVAYQPQGF